jgi:hypothetical protein
MVTNAYHQADDREWTHDRKFEPSSRYKDGIDLDLIQVTDDDEDRTSHTNRLKLGTGESLKLTNTREIYNVNHKYVSQTTPTPDALQIYIKSIAVHYVADRMALNPAATGPQDHESYLI